MFKIARRWMQATLLAAGGTAVALTTLLALGPDPAAADRTTPAAVDHSGQPADRIVPSSPPATQPAAAGARKCPGHGPGAWVDAQQPPALKPPSAVPDLPCLTATVVIIDGTLCRVTVARARGQLDSRGVADLDPRPS